MNVISKLAIALVMAAGAATASAQEHAHGGHEAHAGQQAAAPTLVEAEVKKVDKEAGKITLRHGDITNLNMPGMTMAFRTKDAAMLDQVLPNHTRHWPHMMCGPAPMLAAIRAGLAGRGTPLSAIHAEIFEMV